MQNVSHLQMIAEFLSISRYYLRRVQQNAKEPKSVTETVGCDEIARLTYAAGYRLPAPESRMVTPVSVIGVTELAWWPNSWGQQLFWLSSSSSRCRTPRRSMFQYGIEHNQQLAHAGRQGHFLGFSGGTQAAIEGLDHGIIPSGDQGTHISRGSDVGSTTPDRTPSPQGATITIEWSHAYQGRDLLLV